MTFYILTKSDSVDGSWEPEVHETLESAKESLQAEYENLCAEDGDYDIEYDEDEMTLSWLDADYGEKYWCKVEKAYISNEAVQRLLHKAKLAAQDKTEYSTYNEIFNDEKDD